jgi:hypothetical protein
MRLAWIAALVKPNASGKSTPEAHHARHNWPTLVGDAGTAGVVGLNRGWWLRTAHLAKYGLEVVASS